MIIEDLELRISKVLRIGVLISGLMLLVGWALTAIDGGSSLFIFKDYDQLALNVQLAIALKNNQWGILISFVGLATLILLPVTRVALTAILFFYQKEYKIGFIALFVLFLLTTSFFLGIKS